MISNNNQQSIFHCNVTDLYFPQQAHGPYQECQVTIAQSSLVQTVQMDKFNLTHCLNCEQILYAVDHVAKTYWINTNLLVSCPSNSIICQAIMKGVTDLFFRPSPVKSSGDYQPQDQRQLFENI
jgi:hypothetical protein